MKDKHKRLLHLVLWSHFFLFFFLFTSLACSPNGGVGTGVDGASNYDGGGIIKDGVPMDTLQKEAKNDTSITDTSQNPNEALPDQTVAPDEMTSPDQTVEDEDTPDQTVTPDETTSPDQTVEDKDENLPEQSGGNDNNTTPDQVSNACLAQKGYCSPSTLPCKPGYKAAQKDMGCSSAAICCLPDQNRCKKEGEFVDIAKPVPEQCCANLKPAPVALPPACVPQPGAKYICVRCGDKKCNKAKGENICNCPVDCQNSTQSCWPKDTKLFTCPDGKEVPWCTCNGKPPCIPACKYAGTRSEGWYDSCSGKRLQYTFCSKCAAKPKCLHVGSKSEGWYDCNGKLIQYAMCGKPQGTWSCIKSPENQCKTNLKCKTNGDCGKPTCLSNSIIGNSCIQITPICKSGQCSAEKKTYPNSRCDKKLGRCVKVTPPKCKTDADCGKPTCKAFSGGFVQVCLQKLPKCNNGICATATKNYTNYICQSNGLCQPKTTKACWPQDTKLYTCPNGKKVPWCTCKGRGPCIPVCRLQGTRSEGWYDSCSGTRLKWGCNKCTTKPKCLHIGSKSEGWYDCHGNLIKYTMCGKPQGSWSCIKSPENQCKTSLRCKKNDDCGKPTCTTNPLVANSCIQMIPLCKSNLCSVSKKSYSNSRCDKKTGRCTKIIPPKCKTDADCGKPTCKVFSGGFAQICLQKLPKCNNGVCSTATKNYTNYTCQSNGLCQPKTSKACWPKDTKLYTCPDGKKVPWCTCNGKPPCIPICKYIGSRSEGWYDSCSGTRLQYTFCSKCTAKPKCLHIGSKSEGWYDCNGKLIKYAMCGKPQGSWSCIKSPENQCKTSLKCKTNGDCGKPTCMSNPLLPNSCTQILPFCKSGQCTSIRKSYSNSRCDKKTGLCAKITPPKCKTDADCGKPSCSNVAGGLTPICRQNTPKCNNGVCSVSMKNYRNYICQSTGLCRPVKPPVCRTNSDCGKTSCKVYSSGLTRICVQTTPICQNSKCTSKQQSFPNYTCSSKGTCIKSTSQCRTNSDCGKPSCKVYSSGLTRICVQTTPICQNSKCTSKQQNFPNYTCSSKGTCIKSTVQCRTNSDCGKPTCRNLSVIVCLQQFPVCNSGRCTSKSNFLHNKRCNSAKGLCL